MENLRNFAFFVILHKNERQDLEKVSLILDAGALHVQTVSWTAQSSVEGQTD
jgi:hypothetical protein